MSTMAQLIDRLYREYLYPASNQPTRAILAEDLDTSETGVDLTTTILTPEEIDLFGEGVLLEVDQELMLVTGWSSPTATVIRGWQGTTAATHLTNAPVYLAPQFGRLQVFNAVCDSLVDLYPELYARKRRLYPSTSSAYIDIDSSAVEVMSYVWDDDGRPRRGSVEFTDEIGGAPKIYLTDVPPGVDGWLTYHSRFPRPTAESDDLGDTNGDWALPPEWERIVMVDSLAAMVAASQVDKLNVDFIVELLMREGFTISDSRQVVGGLLALRREWVDRAKSQLHQRTPITVERNSRFRGPKVR